MECSSLAHLCVLLGVVIWELEKSHKISRFGHYHLGSCKILWDLGAAFLNLMRFHGIQDGGTQLNWEEEAQCSGQDLGTTVLVDTYFGRWWIQGVTPSQLEGMETGELDITKKDCEIWAKSLGLSKILWDLGATTLNLVRFHGIQDLI